MTRVVCNNKVKSSDTMRAREATADSALVTITGPPEQPCRPEAVVEEGIPTSLVDRVPSPEGFVIERRLPPWRHVSRSWVSHLVY